MQRNIGPSNALLVLLIGVVILITGGVTPVNAQTQYNAQDAPAYSYTQRLHRGITHPEVSLLQKFLTDIQYLSSQYVTGFFGTLTEKAVKAFQCDKKIVCKGDAKSTGWGMVWKKTWNALRAQQLTALTLASSTPSSITDTADLPGLAGYWSFEEGSGTTTVDASGNNNTGTLTNGPAWTSGKIGHALSFDGVNDYVDVSGKTLPGSYGGANSHTYMAWVFLKSYANYRTVVRNDPTTGDAMVISSTGLLVHLFSGGGVIKTSVGKIPLNTWTHVAISQNGDTTKPSFYINGAFDSTAAVEGSWTGNNAFLIGARTSNNSPFMGSIDEVRIYNRALSAAEISNLYAEEIADLAALGSVPDITPPTVSLTAPSPNATVSGSVTINATASDNVGVARVRFFVDGTLKSTSATSPYSFSWDTTDGGTQICDGPHSHSLTAKAYDATGNAATSPNVVVNTNNPSYCYSPPVASSVTPIPALARWERSMQLFGRLQGDPVRIAAEGLWDGGVSFYDGTRVFYQIADYTGSEGWNFSAHTLADLYRAKVLELNGALAGWRIFPKGLYMDYKRTGNEKSKQAAILLSKNGAFCPQGGSASEGLSRETAYCINSYLIAELLGEPRNPKLSVAIDNALGHIDQWFVKNTSTNWAPFMFGLTSEALISYYEQVKPEPRILAAIKLGVDAVWDRAWIEKNQAFWYRLDSQTPAPDLNMLIAPAFAWVYKQTGDVKYRDRGDKIFAGGVAGAFLYSGKVFSQNYHNSFDYVQSRLNAPVLGDATAPVVSNVVTSVAGTDVIVNWTTNEPANSQIEYGTAANDLNQKTALNAYLVTNHSQTLHGLTPGTTYSFRIRSADANGNIGLSATGAFTATATDTVAPVVTSVNPIISYVNDFKFEWETPYEDSDARVEWGLTTDYGFQSPLQSLPLTRLHSVQVKQFSSAPADVLMWLKNGVTYHYRVTSHDAAGNLGTSGDRTFVAGSGGSPTSSPTLTITMTGTGMGAVTGAGSYPNGAVVKMTATPATGSTFAGWTGAGCATGTVTLTANTTCTATFTLISSPSPVTSRWSPGTKTMLTGDDPFADPLYATLPFDATYALVDWDGDGLLDLMVIDGAIPADGVASERKLVWFKNIGTKTVPKFGKRMSLMSLHTHNNLAVADVDGDGKLEIVIMRPGIQIAHNSGTPTAPIFDIKPVRTDGWDASVYDGPGSGPVLVDWDGDGRIDLVAGLGHNPTLLTLPTGNAGVYFYRNVGVGAEFALAPPVAITAGGVPINILEPTPSPADLKGDGHLDLLVAGYGGAVYFFENTAEKGKLPVLAKSVILQDANGPLSGSGGRFNVLHTGDLNGDGIPDLVEIGEYSRDTAWFWPGILKGGATPSSPTVTLTSPTPNQTIDDTTVIVSYAKQNLTGNEHLHLTLDSNPEVRDIAFTGSYTFSNVPAGSHTLSGYLADNATHARLSGTEVSVSFTTTGSIKTPPTTLVISSPSVPSITSRAATITWTTNNPASSRVYYFGSDAKVGTPEIDTTMRVTSHSVTLSKLIPCTIYQYAVYSHDATNREARSAKNKFTTKGCLGESSILDHAEKNIVAHTQDSLTLTNANNSSISVSIPQTLLNQDTTFQIQKLDKGVIPTAAPLPTQNYRIAGDNIYELEALSDQETLLTSFSTPLTVTLIYNPADIQGLDISTLKLYRFDGTQWMPTQNCVVSISTHTITCMTDHFSPFILMGTPDITPPNQVTDLSSTNLTQTSADLSWTAPGDNGNQGTAASYDIRYAPTASFSFSTSTQATGKPAPALAGTKESYILVGLTTNTAYSVALTATDSAGNPSTTSNIIQFTTLATPTTPAPTPTPTPTPAPSGGGGGGSSYIPDTTPPPQVANFTATRTPTQSISLAWTNPASSNFVRTRILRKLGSAPISQTDGAIIYEGTASTTIDIFSASAPIFYSAFTLDRAPNYSSPVVVSISPLPSPLPVPVNIPVVPLPSYTPLPRVIPLLTRTLALGSRNKEVLILQDFLVNQRYLNLKFKTGRFGNGTLAALKKYQCDKKIVCRVYGWGRVGKATRAYINQFILK